MKINIFFSPSDFDLVHLHQEFFADSGFIVTFHGPNISEKFPTLNCIDDLHDADDAYFMEHLRLHTVKRNFIWYYQQFLKLKSVYNSDTDVFVHDGDTFFPPSLILRAKTSKLLFVTEEKVNRYNKFSKLKGISTSPKSFIANGNWMSHTLIRRIWKDLDQLKSDILECATDKNETDFSEYQILGSTMANHGWQTYKLLHFRRGDLVGQIRRDFIKESLKYYDSIAFERSHRRDLLRRLKWRLKYLMHTKNVLFYK